MPLIDLAEQLVLPRLLVGKVSLGLAEPRRQCGALGLGLVQRRGELRNLVAFGYGGLIAGSGLMLVALKLGPYLLGERGDLALRRGEIAVRRRNLVTQAGQLIL